LIADDLSVAAMLDWEDAAITPPGVDLVYWQGGDRRVEDRLFAPEISDRIVVWGAPAAVESVRACAGRSDDDTHLQSAIRRRHDRR
jgi:aminoglycoside phosphotransferase (APT) family kinase protein